MDKLQELLGSDEVKAAGITAAVIAGILLVLRVVSPSTVNVNVYNGKAKAAKVRKDKKSKNTAGYVARSLFGGSGGRKIV